MSSIIRKPIFIIGSPRSGTNAFYYRLAKHPDLAAITTISKKFPASLILTRLLANFRSDHTPTEGSNIWNKFVCRNDDALYKEDVTHKAKKYLHKVVCNNLLFYQKPRFISKYPQNSVRIGYLREIFPDAFFIHIVRDGRAVTNSLRNSWIGNHGHYWSIRPPGWQDLPDKPLLEACALQWKLTVYHTLQQLKALPEEQYMQIKYEDFVKDPVQIFTNITNKLELSWSGTELENSLSGLQDKNYKWRSAFSHEEKQQLQNILEEPLYRLGYTQKEYTAKL